MLSFLEIELSEKLCSLIDLAALQSAFTDIRKKILRDLGGCAPQVSVFPNRNMASHTYRFNSEEGQSPMFDASSMLDMAPKELCKAVAAQADAIFRKNICIYDPAEEEAFKHPILIEAGSDLAAVFACEADGENVFQREYAFLKAQIETQYDVKMPACKVFASPYCPSFQSAVWMYGKEYSSTYWSIDEANASKWEEEIKSFVHFHLIENVVDHLNRFDSADEEEKRRSIRRLQNMIGAN